MAGRTGVSYKAPKPEIKTLEPLAPSKAKALLAKHGEEWLVNHILDRGIARARERSVQPLTGSFGQDALLEMVIEDCNPDRLSAHALPVVLVDKLGEQEPYWTPIVNREHLARSKRGATEIEFAPLSNISDARIAPKSWTPRESREDKSTWIPLAPIKS